MDTDSFVIYIKIKDIYKDIADDVKKRYDANYEVDRSLPKGMNKKVIGSMKDELGGQIMIELVALRPKTYSYITDYNNNVKKAKDYRDYLLKNEIILKSQQKFKREVHYVYTEEINKIALSSNDDKRLQTFDRITTYPYGTNAF